MLWAGVRMTLISCALASLIALSSDPLSESAESISCLVSPPAPLRTIDRFRAALTGERTTLPLGLVFWTALSKRKPNALSAAATSTDADGGAACVAAGPNRGAATNLASSPCLRCMVPLSAGGRHSLVPLGPCQLIDQTHSGRATPTGHQIVAGDGVEAAAVARPGRVAAAVYVMEGARVARARAEVVERGIDEAHRAPAVRHGLLIDQRQKTCPARRGKARAAE